MISTRLHPQVVSLGDYLDVIARLAQICIPEADGQLEVPVQQGFRQDLASEAEVHQELFVARARRSPARTAPR